MRRSPRRWEVLDEPDPVSRLAPLVRVARHPFANAKAEVEARPAREQALEERTASPALQPNQRLYDTHPPDGDLQQANWHGDADMFAVAFACCPVMSRWPEQGALQLRVNSQPDRCACDRVIPQSRRG
jgi:hypothetical protein